VHVFVFSYDESRQDARVIV